ncbi:hypothetical protein IF2G_10734 [Cordyceps javanica]|nr:hypothetical protein IF2G_10734 [Cordyceps javanica]
MASIAGVVLWIYATQAESYLLQHLRHHVLPSDLSCE